MRDLTSLRNLLVRLTLWLVRKLNINVLQMSRIANGDDAVVRGSRWESFYLENGGLADMLAIIRREAFETAAEIDPKDTDKIYYWAMADRNVRKLEGRIVGIIQNGVIEAGRRRAVEAEAAMRINRSF